MASNYWRRDQSKRLGEIRIPFVKEAGGEFAQEVLDDFFEAAVGGQQYTMPADAWAVTLSGSGVGLEKGSLVAAAPEVYSTSGTAANVLRGLNISAGIGLYPVTGTDASLRANRNLIANTVAFDETGIAANLFKNSSFSAGIGLYPATGTTAGLLKTNMVIAASGALVLAGSDAGLDITRVAVATPASVAGGGGSSSRLSLNRKVVRLRDYLETRRQATIREKKELREMMDLYSQWRKAA